MNDTGYIKFFRAIHCWAWWSDIVVYRFFTYLLTVVEFTDKPYRGIIVHRGQTAKTLQQMSDECNLSIQQIRTCMNKLKSTYEITVESTNEYHLVTVMNWDMYQTECDKPTDKITCEQTNEQQTSNKHNKNIRKKEVKNTYGEFQNVRLSDDEREKVTDSEIESLSYYIKSKGDKYKDHYATILNWRRKNGTSEPKPMKSLNDQYSNSEGIYT